MKTATLRVFITNSLMILCFASYAQSPGNVSSNLKLWLKANAGVTGTSPVTAWGDQSSSSLDATASGSPALVTDGLNFNPTIAFDGSADRFITASTSLFSSGSSPASFFIVFDTDNGSSQRFLVNQRYNNNCNTNIQLGYTAGGSSRNYGLHIGCGHASGAPTGTIQDNTFYLMSTLLLSSGNAPTNINIFQNGASLTVSNNSNGFTDAGSYDTQSVPIDIGVRNDAFGGSSFDGYHDGDIAEIIVYTSTPTATERQQIESYLAIKYGLTLDQTSPTNYLASDGGTIWDGTANAAYNTDLAGIGRDDNSALDQPKSKSVNSNAILTIANGGIYSPSTLGTNDSWLVWGSDNGSLTFSETVDKVTSGTSSRMARAWRVQETGTVGEVEVAFPVAHASGTISMLIHPSDPAFPNDANRDIYEMENDGTYYRVTVDLSSGDYFSFAEGSVDASPAVLINEIVATPRQDWSVGSFYNPAPGGTNGSDDEWIELYIAEDGLDLTGWTIEFDDGGEVIGDLTSSGAFTISNYLSLQGGSFKNTKNGDFLILGNPIGSELINATGTSRFYLRDASGKIIDQVTTSTTEGTFFNANSTGTTDESISRIPNGGDTNVDQDDFSKTRATLGTTNSPSGTVKINEVVTDPQQDWSSIGFNGTAPGGTGADNDEYIELYIASAGLNLTRWTLEMKDGSDVSGTLSTTGDGVFATVNYITAGSGSFIDTEVGDYLILGNPTGAMNNDVLVILKDATGTAVDSVQLGGAAGEAPTGNAASANDEAVSRYANAVDTGDDDLDFARTIASPGSTNSPTGTVLINEIVTDPQQDWSTNGFDGTIAGGLVSDVDQWIELYIGSSGINLTGWTIELTDGTDVIGDLTSSGAFDVSNYISNSVGSSFLNTAEGDYLILGNVDGTGATNDDILITLKDAAGNIVDQVELGDDAAGDGIGDGAPDGSSVGGDATDLSNESISRIPNGTDTGNDVADFQAISATLGQANSTSPIPVIGNGLLFDGIEDYVLIANDADLDFNQSGFTVEFWGFITNINSFALAKGTGGTGNEYFFEVDATGKIRFGVTRDNDTQYTSGWSTTDIRNEWYHIAGIFNGGSIDLHINGVMENSTGWAGSMKTGQGDFFIGKQATGDFMAGKIDEVRIWNDIRAQSEICQNMNKTINGNETNLVAYYRFDQGSGLTLPDITVNNNDGTLNNMTSADWVVAEWNVFSDMGLILDGGGSDISPGTSANLTITDVDFLQNFNDYLIFGHENSDFSEVTSDLPSGTLVSARYDRNWHIAKSDVVGTAGGDVTLSFDLGATPNSDYTYYLLERAGTSGDFSIVPVDGTNPSGTSIVFTINASQINDDSYYTIGRSDTGVGNALDFDGVDDFVTIGNTTDFDWMHGANNASAFQLTFSFWVKMEDPEFNNLTYLINTALLSSANTGAGLLYDDRSAFGFDRNLRFYVVNGSGTATIDDSGVNFMYPNDTEWHHLAVTYDQSLSADNATYYLDGVLIRVDTKDAGTPATGASDYPLTIGAGANSSAHFEGIIDEVQIWSDVRTQQEIVSNMFSNLGGDEANLVAYYRMNDGIGDGNASLPDLSGNGNSGTLTNFDNLNAATASSNYLTSTRTTFQNASLIVNGGALTASSDELTLTSTQTAGDFLQDAGDQIIWGNDGGNFSEVATDLLSGTLLSNRIDKTWYLDKNDAVGTANGNLTFSFDLGAAPNPDYTYYLLTRAGTSGDFSIMEVISSVPSANSIEFTVDGAQVVDGNYFTLGRSDSGAGNALDFDGTDDYVDLDNLGLTSGTIEMWIYANDVIDNRRIYSQLTGATSQAGSIGIDPNNTDDFGIFTWTGAAWLELVDVGSDWSGAWHHFAVVYSGGVATAYWDGVPQLTQTTNLDFSGVSMGVGAQYTGGNGTTFNGKIDELRIWDDARSQSEIQQNMYRSLDVANESNLVAYYKFDQGIADGTNTGIDLLTDHSGNDNSGNLTNFALSSTASNWVGSSALVVDESSSQALVGPGNALDFDGTDDYVMVSSPYTGFTNALSVEFWVNATAMPPGSILGQSTSDVNAAATNVFLIGNDGSGGDITFYVADGSGFPGVVTTTTNFLGTGWHHVACVSDGAATKIYVDGILEGTGGGVPSINSNLSAALHIGKDSRYSTTRFFDGIIDEVRIWNTARTSMQIQENMFEELTGSETGLVAYYRFDEATGSTTLPDESTNSNTGTLTSMDAATDWVTAAAREPFKTLNGGNWNSTSTWKSGAVPNASTAVLNIKHDITLDASVSADMININDGVTLTLASGQTLSISGNIIDNGTITGDGSILLSSGTPMLGGTFGNLTVNGASPTLTANTTLSGTLTLTSGNITLGDYNLTINSGGSIAGGSSSSYVQTLNQNTGGGALQLEVANGSGPVIFPVGTSTYTPFTMVNLGATADFQVRVFDGTYSGGTYGTAHVTDLEINRTWDINSGDSGYNTTITIQWNASEEDASFNRADMFISKNRSDGYWRIIADNLSAAGANPYTASASGVTSFSQIGAGSDGSPLPVSLVHFSGQVLENDVLIQWKTATESNNDYFILERASSSREFEPIHKVEGAGDSDLLLEYDFMDRNPFAGHNFYRLKQVDFDGAHEYSSTILINNESLPKSWSVYPNPFVDDITFIFGGDLEGEAELIFYNLAGKKINSYHLNMVNGRLNINHLQLPDGVYTMKLIHNGQEFTQKVIKE